MGLSELDRNRRIPLYHQLEQALLAEVRAARPHTRLPSEHELTGRFGVSRGTVKQAIANLEQQGLLYRIQGKGTFVAEPRVTRSFDGMPSFSADIRRQGHRVGIRVLDLALMPPPARVQERLEIPAHLPVWKAQRVYLADGDPLVLATSYIRSDVAPELPLADVQTSLYDTLQGRYDARPVWARDTYSVVLARERIARLVGVPEGGALIYSERVAYLPDLRAVEYCESFIRGDRFTITVNRMPPVFPG